MTDYNSVDCILATESTEFNLMHSDFSDRSISLIRRPLDSFRLESLEWSLLKSASVNFTVKFESFKLLFTLKLVENRRNSKTEIESSKN